MGMEEPTQLEGLVGRAISDPEFRAYLWEDPEGAAASIGIELSEENVARIRDLDRAAVDHWIQAFIEFTDLPIHMMRTW